MGKEGNKVILNFCFCFFFEIIRGLCIVKTNQLNRAAVGRWIVLLPVTVAVLVPPPAPLLIVLLVFLDDCGFVPFVEFFPLVPFLAVVVGVVVKGIEGGDSAMTTCCGDGWTRHG